MFGLPNRESPFCIIDRDRNSSHKNTISSVKFSDVEMIPVHVCVSMFNNKQAIVLPTMY